MLVPCKNGWALLHLEEGSFHAAGHTEMLNYHQMVNFLIEESIKWTIIKSFLMNTLFELTMRLLT